MKTERAILIIVTMYICLYDNGVIVGRGEEGRVSGVRRYSLRVIGFVAQGVGCVSDVVAIFVDAGSSKNNLSYWRYL